VGSEPGSSRFHLFSHFFTTLPLSHSGSPNALTFTYRIVSKMKQNLQDCKWLVTLCMIGFCSGWPDWANVSPLRRSCTLGSFWKITKEAHFLVCLFPRKKLSINFDIKWVGLHFGRYFQKLILTPWSCYICDAQYTTDREIEQFCWAVPKNLGPY
jgi:hypothetical protein